MDLCKQGHLKDFLIAVMALSPQILVTPVGTFQCLAASEESVKLVYDRRAPSGSY